MGAGDTCKWVCEQRSAPHPHPQRTHHHSAQRRYTSPCCRTSYGTVASPLRYIVTVGMSRTDPCTLYS